MILLPFPCLTGWERAEESTQAAAINQEIVFIACTYILKVGRSVQPGPAARDETMEEEPTLEPKEEIAYDAKQIKNYIWFWKTER